MAHCLTTSCQDNIAPSARASSQVRKSTCQARPADRLLPFTGQLPTRERGHTRKRALPCHRACRCAPHAQTRRHLGIPQQNLSHEAIESRASAAWLPSVFAVHRLVLVVSRAALALCTRLADRYGAVPRVRVGGAHAPSRASDRPPSWSSRRHFLVATVMTMVGYPAPMACNRFAAGFLPGPPGMPPPVTGRGDRRGT